MDRIDPTGCWLQGRRRVHVFPRVAAILTALARARRADAARPAPLEDLGRALWGPSACWPEDWRNSALNAVCQARAALRHAGTTAGIVTQLGRGYLLTADIEIADKGQDAGGTVTETERSVSP